MIESKQKIGDFISHLFLVIILLIGAAVFLFVPPLPGKKETAVVSLSVCYFLWGLWYHQRKDHLSIKIILEYLLVAVLGAVLLLALI
jgi:hypothetical protein